MHQALEQAVSDYLMLGWRIEHSSDIHAILAGGGAKPVNHALHAVLSVFTFGFWLPIWLLLMIGRPAGEERLWLWVDGPTDRINFDHRRGGKLISRGTLA